MMIKHWGSFHLMGSRQNLTQKLHHHDILLNNSISVTLFLFHKLQNLHTLLLKELFLILARL